VLGARRLLDCDLLRSKRSVFISGRISGLHGCSPCVSVFIFRGLAALHGCSPCVRLACTGAALVTPNRSESHSRTYSAHTLSEAMQHTENEKHLRVTPTSRQNTPYARVRSAAILFEQSCSSKFIRGRVAIQFGSQHLGGARLHSIPTPTNRLLPAILFSRHITCRSIMQPRNWCP
jgi:hypothetical protein